MARKNVLNRAIETPDATPANVEPMADNLVTVKALAWIGEDGKTYKPGDEFKTTPERAESLVAGMNVKVLS